MNWIARGFTGFGSLTLINLLLRSFAKETTRGEGKVFCIKVATEVLIITKIGNSLNDQYYLIY